MEALLIRCFCRPLRLVDVKSQKTFILKPQDDLTVTYSSVLGVNEPDGNDTDDIQRPPTFGLRVLVSD